MKKKLLFANHVRRGYLFEQEKIPMYVHDHHDYGPQKPPTLITQQGREEKKYH